MLVSLYRRVSRLAIMAACGLAFVLTAQEPAQAKKDGNEVRQESGSSGIPSTSDDRQVRDATSGRDDGASSDSGRSGNSGRGSSNSGSTRNGGLDEVSKRVDDSAGAPPDGSRPAGEPERVQRVKFNDGDRL